MADEAMLWEILDSRKVVILLHSKLQNEIVIILFYFFIDINNR